MRCNLQFLLAIFVCGVVFLSGREARAESRLILNDEGLFKFEHESVDVVSSRFVFWRDEWKWVGLGLKQQTNSGQRSFGNSNGTEWLSLQTDVPAISSMELSWTINIDLPPTSEGRVYGGISFRLNTRPFSSDGADLWPVLDEDQKGWRLKLGDAGPTLTVRFDRQPVKIAFERGGPKEIRAYLVAKKEASAQQSIEMKVSLDGVEDAALAQRPEFEPVDNTKWRKGIVAWDRFPVDLSFLNSDHLPAGRHGRVRSDGDRLVFGDGTPARFWGTNITAYSLFRTLLTKECEPAKRIAALGYNLVRIHHHDSEWVQPNIFGDAKGDTGRLSSKSLAALDRWIACLQQQGIYVWLDLHVGRTISKSDGMEHFEEARKGKNRANLKGFNYVNDSIVNLMKRFNEQYLNHVNEVTGVAYKDDPSIVAMLITNENDLTHHFGNALLPDKNVPIHNKIYMAKAKAFAERWQLDWNRVWRSWEFGPSKLFLSDLEHQFNDRMIAQLRSLGTEALLATTNTWGAMSLAGHFSLTDGDIIDVHSYGGPAPLRANPNFKSTLVDWISAGQVEGMPISVTEWGMGSHPVKGRASLPPQVAAVAALQGWDALMHYAYFQGPPGSNSRPRNWQAFDDPAILSLMPAAALMYRQGHVSEAKKTYALDFGEKLINEKIDPTTSAAIRTLTEQSKVVVRLPRPQALPWLKKARSLRGAIPVKNPDRRFLATDAEAIVSDTGEYKRNWREGVFRVDTPRTQMVGGWIGGRTAALSEVQIESRTPYAAVSVQSLTEAPISRSQRLLISMGAQSVPQGKHYISEPVLATISIKASPGLTLSRLTATGKKKAVPVDYDGSSYRIDTSEHPTTWWYLLE